MLAVKEKFRSNMNITRIDKKEGNYTRISNDLINDSRLSLKEVAFKNIYEGKV